MLETLISSKTRTKLLLKFFLNQQTIAYLRGLEAEFGDSSNAIRLELNRLEKAGLLLSFNNGNKKYFQANQTHPLFKDINGILIKYTGLDQVIESISTRLGNVEKVYLAGSFSKGLDSPIIDLIMAGRKPAGTKLPPPCSSSSSAVRTMAPCHCTDNQLEQKSATL